MQEGEGLHYVFDGYLDAGEFVEYLGHGTAHTLGVFVHVVGPITWLQVFLQLLAFAMPWRREVGNDLEEVASWHSKWVQILCEKATERQAAVFVLVGQCRRKRSDWVSASLTRIRVGER